MNCPKCKQPAELSGELTYEDSNFQVFLCNNEKCKTVWEFGEGKFPTFFTFAVDQNGIYFDPESMERLSIN
jgi:hypothetical protein